MQKLLSYLTFESNNEWLVGLFDSVLIILICLLFLALKKTVVQKILKKILGQFKLSAEQTIFRTLDQFIRRGLVLIAARLIAQSFPLPPKIQVLIQDGIFIALTALILLFSYDLLNVLASNLNRWGAGEFLPLFSKLFKILFACFGLMVIMRHFNYDIWHIATALGIGSLAIGLAAQPTLSNMIAGFTLLIDRPIRPADHVLLASGNEGDVLHIGMRSTWIQTSDGNVLVVPNSELVSSRLINFNYPDTRQYQKIKYQFEHNQNISAIKDILRSCAERVPGITKDPLKIYCSGIVDGKLEISLIYRLEAYATADGIRDQIIETTLNALNEKKIKIASNYSFSPLIHPS